jgi:hypothetical protein
MLGSHVDIGFEKYSEFFLIPVPVNHTIDFWTAKNQITKTAGYPTIAKQRMEQGYFFILSKRIISKTGIPLTKVIWLCFAAFETVSVQYLLHSWRL